MARLACEVALITCGAKGIGAARDELDIDGGWTVQQHSACAAAGWRVAAA